MQNWNRNINTVVWKVNNNANFTEFTKLVNNIIVGCKQACYLLVTHIDPPVSGVNKLCLRVTFRSTILKCCYCQDSWGSDRAQSWHCCSLGPPSVYPQSRALRSKQILLVISPHLWAWRAGLLCGSGCPIRLQPQLVNSTSINEAAQIWNARTWKEDVTVVGVFDSLCALITF